MLITGCDEAEPTISSSKAKLTVTSPTGTSFVATTTLSQLDESYVDGLVSVEPSMSAEPADDEFDEADKDSITRFNVLLILDEVVKPQLVTIGEAFNEIVSTGDTSADTLTELKEQITEVETAIQQARNLWDSTDNIQHEVGGIKPEDWDNVEEYLITMETLVDQLVDMRAVIDAM